MQRNGAVAESRRRLQAIFENSLDPILLTDNDGRFVDANPAACQLIGYRLEELLQRCVFDVTPGHHRAAVSAKWNQFLVEGKLTGAYTVLCNGGALRKVECRGVANIRPGLHLLVQRDITERHRAEENLRRNEALLAEAQRLAHLGSWEWDITNNTVTWSDELYRIFGLKPEEFGATYEAYLERVHPGDRQNAMGVIERALQERGAFECFYRIVRPDGDVRIVHGRGRVAVNGTGNAVRLLGACQDITERRRAEQRLEESHNLLGAVVEGIPQAVYVKDRQGRYLLANSVAASYVGKPLEEVLGQDDMALFGPESGRQFMEVDRRLMASGESETREDVATAAGVTRAYLTTKGAFRSATGEILGIIGISRDITQRKEAEESLRTTEEFLSRLLENIPAGVYVNSTEGRVRLVNRAWEKFFGLARKQVLGRCLEELLSPEVAKSSRASDRRVIDTGAALAFEEQIDIHGCLCWFHTVKFPLYDGAGRIEAVGGISMDVTERRLAEETMRTYADRLHTLSRRVVAVQEEERRRLAHELHDEIGQVLTAISMGLHTAKKSAGSIAGPQLDTCLEIVGGAIEQVRSLSLRLRPTSLDLVGLEAAVRWNLDRQAGQGGLVAQLESNLGGQRLPPELEIAGFRVFQEALTNVVRHAQAHHLWIKLDLQERELHLVIQDDGVGFDVAACERRAAQGGSFGLAGMRERVMVGGGNLIIHSSPGGTEIHVCLPLIHAQLPAR